MKKLVLGFLFLAPTLLLAQSEFDGAWRINLQNTQYVGKETHSLKDGVFQCSSCDPKLDAKADGQDHPVTGSPYSDAVNIRVVDDRTVEVVSKKNGKMVSSSKISASPDGKMLTTEFITVTQGGQNITGKYTSSRVGAAPAAAHKISGTWQPGKLDNVSENAMEVTYKSNGDGLSMSDKSGNSYTAKFDGKDYPYKGDPGVTSVVLRKIDGRTVEETYKRDGKIIAVNRMTIAPGGKTMTVSAQDKVRDVTIKWTASKR